MTNISIVTSTLPHARELAKTIRVEDQDEARALGLAPHRALFYAYKHALLRRTCLVDGLPAAMWGVCGNPLGLVGHPYLITGDICNKVNPITFARIYMDQSKDMAALFPILENYVHASYKGAVGMLKLAGYDLSDPILINGSEFYRFSKVS